METRYLTAAEPKDPEAILPDNGEPGGKLIHETQPSQALKLTRRVKRLTKNRGYLAT